METTKHPIENKSAPRSTSMDSNSIPMELKMAEEEQMLPSKR